jgi:ABC-type uncharacterized transport system ATPase component
MSNLYLTIGIIGSLLISHGAVYLQGKKIERANYNQQVVLINQVREEAARGAAEAIAKIEIKQVTIKQELQREILTNTVYRECQHNDVGMQLLNSALSPPDTR